MAILSGDNASTKEPGLVRLATVNETLAGVDETIATTPLGVASYVAQLIGSAPAALNTYKSWLKLLRVMTTFTFVFKHLKVQLPLMALD